MSQRETDLPQTTPGIFALQKQPSTVKVTAKVLELSTSYWDSHLKKASFI
jgi:hypothetical protein